MICLFLWQILKIVSLLIVSTVYYQFFVKIAKNFTCLVILKIIKKAQAGHYHNKYDLQWSSFLLKFIQFFVSIHYLSSGKMRKKWKCINHTCFFFFHFGDGHPLSSFLHVNKSLAMFPVDQRRLKWNHSVRKPHSNTREGHESLSYESEKMYYQSSSSTSVYKQREANVSCFYSFYGQFEDFRDWTKKSCPNSKDLVNIDSV